jgi:hypothetical protein
MIRRINLVNSQTLLGLTKFIADNIKNYHMKEVYYENIFYVESVEVYK